MALEVIGSGFGRTGTMSLKLALEQLGLGPCHHMDEVFKRPDQVPLWRAAADGQAVDWDSMFAGFRSQVDWPGAHFWRALAAAYPGAKVIHTVRPEDQWWTSFSGTIGTLLASYHDKPLPPHIRAMMEISADIVGPQTFGAPVTDKQAALAAYRARTDDVRSAIPPERLLVFDVAEGWGPLCGFLGVPTPLTPFPRTNSTEAFWKLVNGAPA